MRSLLLVSVCRSFGGGGRGEESRSLVDSKHPLFSGNTALLTTKKDSDPAASKTITSPRGGRRSATASKNEIVDVSSAGTVTYKGVIVDVGQVLNQIDKLEQERKALEQRLSVMDKDLGKWAEFGAWLTNAPPLFYCRQLQRSEAYVGTSKSKAGRRSER